MANRLLFEEDVIRAVDKHTNDDSQLDDDISCILEEVKDVVIAGSKESIDNLKSVSEQSVIPPMKSKEIKIMPDTKCTFTIPKVFMFNLKDENIDHSKVQKDLKRQISEGCVVLPDCVEFIGIEDSIVVLP